MEAVTPNIAAMPSTSAPTVANLSLSAIGGNGRLCPGWYVSREVFQYCNASLRSLLYVQSMKRLNGFIGGRLLSPRAIALDA